MMTILFHYHKMGRSSWVALVDFYGRHFHVYGKTQKDSKAKLLRLVTSSLKGTYQTSEYIDL